MIYRFGDFELDTGAFELRERGRTVVVEPQVFEVLSHLVANRDRLVTKEELLDRVWGDRFVSESALTSRLKSARRAVGDDGSAQRVIRTHHGRGYRFVAPVEEGGPEAAGAGRTQGAPVPTPVEAGRASSWPLTGRTAEVAVLVAALHDARSGGVLLTGGAGVGKTRLADELATIAAAEGLAVARAVGHPGGAVLPLAALAHLLPSDVAEAGPDGELDRAAVFHRARLALRDRATGGRSLLWVDDVDHLDDLSSAVLASLAVARDVFAVLTMRTPGEVPSGVRALVKDGHLEHLDLAPLDDRTLESLVQLLLDGPVDPNTVERLVGTAHGNAGVLRQLVGSSLDARSLEVEDGVWVLRGDLVATSDLRELVADRLGGLPADAREAMELLAVAGPLGISVLAALVGDDAIELLDERGLLDVRASQRRTDVGLAHPLFGEVLRSGLPVLRHRRCQVVLADALGSTGARRREDMVRITAWRLESGGSVDAGTVASAVRLALAEDDLALAGRLLDRLDDGADPVTSVQLRAEWHFRRGDTDRVEALLAPLRGEDVPAHQWAQIVRRRVANRFYGMGDFDGFVELLDGARSGLEGAPLLALEALRCTLLAMGGEVAQAVEQTAEVLPRTDGPIRLEVLRARALALAVHGRGLEALPVAAEGLRLGATLAGDLDVPGVSMLRFARIVALTELGHLHEAAEAVADSARTPTVDGRWSTVGAARLALATGDPPAVRRVLERPLHQARARRHGATERWLLALVAHSRLDEGDLATAEEELRRVSELEDGPRALFHNEIDRAKAWLAAHREGAGVACELLVRSADDAALRGKRALEATLLHDVVRLGRADLVVATRLRALADTVEGPLVQHRADHAGAALAGDGESLLAVADGFARLGAVLLAAEAAAQAADALAASRDGAGADRASARARELLSRRGTTLRTPALGRLASPAR